MPAPSRSTVIAASIGGFLILAAIVVAVIIPALPYSPSEAAEDWAAARVSGDRERQAELECPGFKGDPFYSVMIFDVFEPRGVKAIDEVVLGDGAWQVTLGWSNPAGDHEVQVEVYERDGEYVLC